MLAARSVFTKKSVVVAQLEIPIETVEAAAELSAEAGARYILNPAPARRLSSNLLKLVHTITPNEYEAQLLTGTKNLGVAAHELLRRGCRNVVITIGARGALVADNKGIRILPAPRVKPVDTVGAGDCFTAWLAVGIAEGLALDAAVSRAVKAAAIAVTRPGAQAGMPFRKEVAS